MEFTKSNASIYIPDGATLEAASKRTTHMGIGAHQDDLEIMALHGILQCFGDSNQWFAGVDVTDGAGSPRAGIYASYTDEEMVEVRRIEQKKAAFIGDYSMQILLEYSSNEVKDASNQEPIIDIMNIVALCRPSVLYTHNPADKHDTHVSVCLRVIDAIRRLPEDQRPKKLYGCEAWRDLDWLGDEYKVLMDCSGRDNLSAALAGVFDSQIAGGKRYDLASTARRRANATYLQSHAVDTFTEVAFGIDLTPLITDTGLDVAKYTTSYIEKFAEDVNARIKRLS